MPGNADQAKQNNGKY